MKDLVFCLGLLIFACPEAFAQAFAGKTIGGPQNEQGICLELTADNGYLLVGNTRSYGSGSNDIYLVKVNSLGLVEWAFPYGILYQDFGMWVEQTNDLGYIVTGYTWGGGYGGEDVVILKTDAEGNQLWKKYIGYPHRDQGFCVQELEDGYIVTGHTMSFDVKGDIYVIRTDTEGNVVWDRNLGTDVIDYSYGIVRAHEGGFILAGTKGGFYNVDLTIFKIPDADAMAIRLDDQGEVVWQKLYGGPGHDWFWSVIPAPETGYYCLGSTQSYGEGSFDMFLVKINEDGEEEWHKTFGGGEYEYGKSLDISPKGYLYLSGTTKSFGQNNSADIYLVKTNASGEKLWTLSLGGDYADDGHCVRATSEDGCVMVGDYQWDNENRDMYLIRVDSLGQIVSLGTLGDLANHNSSLTISPNPFSQNATVLIPGSSAFHEYTVSIFNRTGQCVRSVENRNGEAYSLKRKQLEPGVYYLLITFPDQPRKKLSGTFIIY